MSVKYSKTLIKTIITDNETGEERMYRSHKLSFRSTSRLGFKIIMAITPSLGVMADSSSEESKQVQLLMNGQSHTFAAMAQMLQANLDEDLFEEIVDALFGSLMFGHDEVDLDEHFEKYPQDFIELLVWLFKENLVNFIVKSDMVVTLMDKITPTLSQKMKDGLKSLEKSVKTDSPT